MDWIIGFGYGGKPSHAQPGWEFILAAAFAVFVYWLYLRWRLEMRRRRDDKKPSDPPATP